MIVLPKDDELIVFVLCLVLGGFVIVKYCLDQFDKPSFGSDENDPWRFVVMRLQTPRQQYLTGFAVYCGIMLAIFLIVSLIGPGPILEIVKAIGTAMTDTYPAAAAPAKASLQTNPTFPILVAFYIVGLNPNLPKALDFEIFVRRLAHRIAYIPKNMDRIFNFMRFSEFDLSDQQLERAWEAAELRRTTLDGPDFKSLAPVFNRAVVLYARAGMLAGDITPDGATNLPQSVNLEVFKQYRSEIQNVGLNLQAINARLTDLAAASPGDRKNAVQNVHRDLIKNLERLYVIFASAATTKGIERISDRLRAIGFTSVYPPPPEIPWDPLLKVMGAAAVVMLVSCVIAATFTEDNQNSLVPNTYGETAYLLCTILIVQLVGIWQALNMRARLIGRDKYFSETGYGRAVAYLSISLRCAISALFLYILLYLPNFVPALATAGPNTPYSSTDIIMLFLRNLSWALVPGICGAMTAYTLDRPTKTSYERLVSGLLQGGLMAVTALVAVQFTVKEPALDYRIFVVVLYGGLGFVLGFLLPAAIKRYWHAQEARLPEKIGMLRTTVLRYFRDIQEFMEWLNASNDRLDGKRPLDVLTEESGLQKLTSLVAETRTKVAPVI